ncbi:MAG TPA: M24 family metallopeptidase [Candidatus Dormibacteraeota bacterium]|nr:M24 family metallopeptidase [Candidatus Dormibacteraeota bacterium]
MKNPLSESGPRPDRRTGQGVTRREVLVGASAGLAASLAGSALPAWGQSSSAASSGAGAANAKTLSPADMPKAWSSGEFRRRWRNIRQSMKQSGLDCLIVPQHITQAMIHDRQDGDADVQYLTGIPAGWVVFPVEGKITVISSRVASLLAQKRPIPGLVLTTLFAEHSPEIEVRYTEKEGLWSPSVIDSLREHKMDHARIGVGSLVDLFRNTEGSVIYTSLDRVQKAFPQARFESAVDILWRTKLVHSAEEIDVLEKATRVSEAGTDAMMKTARPGAVHRDVWLNMWRAMVEASGERPWRLSISTRGSGNASFGFPLDDVFGEGQILGQECAGSVLGYGAQVNHSVLLGGPAPKDWVPAGQYCIDLFHTLLDRVAPGKSVKEFCDFFGDKLKARGVVKPGGVLIHSGGLADLPRCGPGRMEGGDDLMFQAGMVFDLKPSVPIRNTHTPAEFGDSIVVTEKGARRLGTRKMELNTLGA